MSPHAGRINFPHDEHPDGNGGTRGSWNSWSEHVLAELKRLNDSYDQLQKDTSENFTTIKIEIAMLKVKSGLWGAAGAMVPILIALLIWIMTDARKDYMSKPDNPPPAKVATVKP